MRSDVAVLLVVAALAVACERVSSSAFNEPWCEVSPLEDKPGHLQPGHYRIHPRLKAAAEAHNLSFLPFPTPASRAEWPNATTIESCRYMAYSPFHMDGLGSQYARMIHIAAWSYLYNVSYIHIQPDHIDHGVNASEIDAFFNLGLGSLPPEDIPVGSTVCLVDHCGPAAVVRDHYRPQVVTQMLRGSLVQMKPMEWISPHAINIGVHIRRGDVMERSKDITSGRWTPDEYYVDIIRNITADLRRHNLYNFEFHIYSQGDLADFANITGPLTGLPLTWHLNEDEILTLRGLICSDILVKAWSGLSTVAEWYSTAVTIPARTGWHPRIHPAAANIVGTIAYLRARLRGRRYMHAGC